MLLHRTKPCRLPASPHRFWANPLGDTALPLRQT